MENDMMAIVMAAGKGTRMKSKSSKLVQKIYGKEIVKRAVENAKKAGLHLFGFADASGQTVQVVKEEKKR